MNKVHELDLPRKKLNKPKEVRNVDGTFLKVQLNGKEKTLRFYLANIGNEEAILGYPFLESLDPKVDWKTATIEGTLKLSLPRKKRNRVPEWIWAIPEWEDGDELWCHTVIGKSTVASELAQQAMEKKKKLWNEIIPEEYHQFAKVFSKEASERFPERWPWDHAIDLKPDAPASIDCKVYPLSPKEKEEQKEFIEGNLQLKRIWQSKSPYASGFFLIRKKDGKFRLVQDYQNLNKWTILNKYPLPLIDDLIHDLAGVGIYTKLDIHWGYNNIRVKEGDEWKATFKTSEGLFKPMVMFFGLTNSPATFQTMMDDIFHRWIIAGWIKKTLHKLKTIKTGLKVYMDNMLIYTEVEKPGQQSEEASAKLQKTCHFWTLFITFQLFNKHTRSHKLKVPESGQVV